MSLFISQKDDRSELQKRLAKELQKKAKLNTSSSDMPDGVEDSQFIKGTKSTSNMALVWILILLVTISIIIWLTVLSMTS